MSLYLNVFTTIFIAGLGCIFFYSGNSSVIFIESLVSDDVKGRLSMNDEQVSDSEWQSFLQLEELIAASIRESKEENNYENFGSQLDKIFDDSFKNYSESLWNESLTRIQKGFPVSEMKTIAPILNCYRRYKSQLDQQKEFTLALNRYRYLFIERINHFGAGPTQTLFAAEFNFLAPQLNLLRDEKYQISEPICKMADLD